MPLRPDLSNGLNLSRRSTTPVKLPRMNFPMIGGLPDSADASAHEAPSGGVEGTVPLPEEAQPMLPARPEQRMPAAPMPAAPQPAPTQREAARVVVYGQAGCEECVAAIQDLIERQISFTYFDVARDAQALAHLQAICGGAPVVPVVVYVGFGGA
jgi:glutaredoxin